MAVSPIKGKLLPFKILVTLLYGEFPWLTRDGCIVEIETGPMARAMICSNSRLHEMLMYLQTVGHLRIHANPHGRTFLVMAPPTGYVLANAPQRAKQSNTEVIS